MTVMDPRPWSPASAHIGPDDEDLAMLEPTGEPEADLGSAVLVVHRVGGAACEAVARAPLPDEFGLVDALANGRRLLAPRAVEAIGKCLGREDAYPDLLLRDLFDVGELGALTVYRSCVAKGVAPPLAAQRAGLVYGVPREDLGRYLAVATEPRAHPVAIADTADRAVARWASGIVRTELADVPVAKRAPEQSLAEYAQSSFGREHPKDTRGRFVDVREQPAGVAEVAGRPAGFLAQLRRDGGVGAQAAPEVAGMPVEAPPVTAPPRRVQRGQRGQRVQRVQSPTAVSRARFKTGLKASLRSKLRGEFGSRLRSRMNAQRNRTEGVEPLQQVSFDSEQEISDQFSQRLGSRMLAWSMSVEQASEIFKSAAGAGTYDRPKHVKMGQLQQILAEPYEWGDQHNEQMRRIAEEVAGDQRPRFILISSDELETAGVPLSSNDEKAVEAAVKDYARMTGYYDQLSHDPDGTYNPLLKADMGLVPSAAPGTHDWYLVINPEPVVYGHPEGVAAPMAAEFIVFDDSSNTARVNIEGTERQRYYEMDPTQHWVIHEPRTLWKQTGENTGYWVDRYSVEPLDEDWIGGKAVATEQRWRTEPRNERGEWTKGGFLARVAPAQPAEQETVTPVVTPLSVSRPQRRQRGQRGQRAQRQAHPRLVTERSGTELNADLQLRLSAPLLRAFRAGLAGDNGEMIDTSMPAWDDRKRYVVFSSDDWDHLLRQTGYRGFRNEVVPRVPLSSAARSNLLSRMRMAVDGTDADTEVRLHVENEIMEKHRDERREIRSLRFHVDERNEAGERQWERAGHQIRNLMAVDHTVQSVRIDSGSRPGEYRVMVNKNPVSDVVVVLLPDDFNPDLPVTLVHAGRARQSALNRNVDRYVDEALHVNAPVQMFRVTQGTKQIWHARQDER